MSPPLRQRRRKRTSAVDRTAQHEDRVETMRRRRLLGLAAIRGVVPLAFASAVLGACTDGYRYHGTVLDPPREAPPLRLIEHGGAVFDLREQRGQVVLLFFGYAQCPDVCPTTMAKWARVNQLLGPLTRRVRYVFVTVDPARDTPALVQAFARRFDPTFIGLSGDSAQVAALERSYMSASYRSTPVPGTGYMVMHGTRTFLINTDVRLRVLYPAETTPENIAVDIRHLLD